MQTPASSVASLSPSMSQQSTTAPFPSHNVPISTNRSPTFTPSPSDTTLSAATRSSNQTPPCAPSTASVANLSSATSPSSMAATQTATSSISDVDPGPDGRSTVGGSDVPIDLRGLSTLPSSNGMLASTAVLGAPRTINLPTLKNPQGELLDLSELASFGDGLTPTQETFSIHSSSPLVSQSLPRPFMKVASVAHGMAPPELNSRPAYQGGAAFTSPSILSPNSSLGSFPSLSSLTSVPSSLSSLTSTPSIGSEGSPSIGSDSSSVNGGLKTPNVYINGLPPNFPEEDLLAMTKPFGEVISVRTFTRHVSDKPSGYGFVLFGSVDGAERCIESLRKYRNLHPSFSKQIHKIPGTSYATVHADSALNVPSKTDDAPNTFKSKMERLKDPNSTNLYMEGLPLSIDEPTLQALVNPYRIMSSRFFRTRLSNPPRIIAFVRLESREAAEEIIERLHGRMVRGWCDAGSRISVRFADTSEQRELRRVERVNHDGENSPARLTMAQAALLNLKGTQMGNTATTRLPSPNFGVVSLPPVIGTAPPAVEPTFVATAEGLRPLPPPIGLHHQSSVDPPTLHSPNCLPFDASALGLAPLDVRSSYGSGDVSVLQMPSMGSDIGAKPLPVTRAQNGFTPMERLILQAHEQRQQQEALAVATGGAYLQAGSGGAQTRYGKGSRTSVFNPAATEFSPSVAGLGRSKPATVTSSVDAGLDRRSLVDFLPTLSEQDFHARAQHQQTIGKSKVEAKALRLDQESRAQFTRQRNQTHAEAQAEAEAEARAAHARSTTVPSHYPNTSMPRGLQQVMSTSATSGNAQARRNNSYNDARDNNTLTHTQIKNISNTIKNAGQHHGGGSRQSKVPASSAVNDHSTCKVDATAQQKTRIDTGSSATRSRPSTAHGEDEDDGSGLDSPALSYSARTSASLSPATPFSAFGETFDGPPMSTGEVGLGVAVGGVNEMANIGVSKGISATVGSVFPDASATSKN